MNTLRLFILLVVISIVFAVIKFTKNPNRSNSYNEKLVDFDSQLVDKIEIKTADEQVVLEKMANQWKVQVGQKQHEAVQTTVEAFLQTIQTIKPSRLISRSVDQWSDYDVDEKGTKVIISRSNDVLLNIILGRFAFEGQRTYYNYVRLEDDNDTYVADNFMKMSLLSQRDDFRNNRVLNIKNDSLVSIDFIYPDSSFSLTKKENIWFRNNFQIDSIQFKNYYDDIKFVMSKSFATIDAAIVPSHQVNFHFSNRSDINIMGSLDEGEWLIKSSENNDEVWKDAALSKKILISNNYF
tara:strand:- start:318 stop:1202 length:885 start_codon:yes stop_codon:yes gene_type:complete